MAVDSDPRFGIDRWSAPSDPWPGRAGWRNLLALITGKAVIGVQSTSATRPAAGIPMRIHKATDTSRYSWDDGTNWQEISPIGDGTVGQGSTAFTAAGHVGTPGTSRVGARVDHTHPQEAWPVQSTIYRFGDAGEIGVAANGAINTVFSAAAVMPAGQYLLWLTMNGHTASRAADAYTDAHWRLLINSNKLHPTWPVGYSRVSAVSTTVFQYTHTGGTLRFDVQGGPDTVAVNLDQVNSYLMVTNLGPAT